MMMFLSTMTPLGQIFGMLLNNLDRKVQGVFMSISAGTFLYIATAEIIIEEFAIAKNKYLKFFIYLTGIGFIVAISFIP